MDSLHSDTAARIRTSEPAQDAGLSPAAPRLFALLRQPRAHGRDASGRPDQTHETPR